jgi:hypothetical protein
MYLASPNGAKTVNDQGSGSAGPKPLDAFTSGRAASGPRLTPPAVHALGGLAEPVPNVTNSWLLGFARFSSRQIRSDANLVDQVDSLFNWSIFMPCPEMKELEAVREKYAERRHTAIKPERERRKTRTGSHRLGQFRYTYLIQIHLRNCSVCRYV